MKKLMSMLLLAAVCAMPLAAATLDTATSVKSIQNKKNLAGLIDRRSSKEKDSFETISGPAFTQSPNGYGWFLDFNDKIALDPATGTVGSTFRSIAPTGSGTLGVMFGESAEWDAADLSSTTQFNESAFSGNQPGARYPTTTVVNGFVFSVFPEMDLVSTDPATQTKPTMAVYSMDDEESSEGIVLKTEDGLYLNGAWSVVADVKYVDGTYHMLTSWFDVNKHDGNSIYHVVVGTCDGDPMDGDDWTFSNYEDVTISTGMTDYGDIQYLECHWGTDGFGFVYTYMMEGTDAVANPNSLGYIYTTDWGETWQMGANPAANPMNVLDHNALFDWKDKFEQAVDGTDTTYVAIEGAFMSNMDGVVTDDNKIHILTHSFAKYKDATGLSSFVFDEAGNAETVVGYYDIVGEFNGTEIVWDKAYMIAQPVGMSTDEGTNHKYTNTYHVKNGYVPGTDIVYASWLDRPVERPAEAPDFQDHGRKFMDDPYFTISHDGGKTWLVDTMTVYSDVPPLSFAKSMMTTDLEEQGWSVAKKGMVDAKGNFVTYAANQYYIEDEPLPGTIGGWYDHKQDLVAFQIKMDVNVGITSQEMSLVRDFELLQNYPNPFNPSTSIKFNLENAANVALTVFNSQGQKVAALVNEKKAAGAHSVNFNAANLNSGVYFYQLNVNGMSQIKKMVLTK